LNWKIENHKSMSMSITQPDLSSHRVEEQALGRAHRVRPHLCDEPREVRVKYLLEEKLEEDNERGAQAYAF